MVLLANVESEKITLLRASIHKLAQGLHMSESVVPSPIGKIRATDLQYKTIREDWNIYELEDGTTLRVKIVAVKISRGIDPKTGETLYTPAGEPYYNIRYRTVIVADVPKELLK